MEAVTCSVCMEIYRQGTRDPLVLPCGHTFCRACIAAVHGTVEGNLLCPTCRRDAGICDISQLPICYPLVSLSSSYSDIKLGLCWSHEEEQRFWCQDCELPLCSLCLYSDHQRDHLVLPAKTVMEDKKLCLNKQLEELCEEVTQGRSQIYDIYNDLIIKIKRVLSLEEKVDLLSVDMEDASCVEDILACESKIKSLGEENEAWLSSKLDEIATKTEEMKVVDASPNENRAGNSDIPQQPLKESAEVAYEKSRMRLDYREGRLLLHSTAHPADGRLSFKVPTEVFLELGMRGRCLGRVYISLWCQLRRAQQFLALCMGTMGPSYVGSCFSHVAYQGKPKETLCCKEYLTEHGKLGTRELMTDLEWGQPYSGEPRAGLLIPLSKLVNQHGFGICTRGNPGGTFHCPFGKVVAGLEVVLAAVKHDPVTDVTITHCGLVFPELVMPCLHSPPSDMP